MYADDTLLLLTDLNNSILNLTNLIETFARFSGFKVNKTKSSVMYLNEQEQINPMINHPFKMQQMDLNILELTLLQPLNT